MPARRDSHGRFLSTDHGYDAMIKRVFGFQRPKIFVGILEAQGDETKTESHGQEEPLTVLDVAIWNEFGTDRVPARSFIRAWFDEDRQNLRDDLFTLMRSVIAGTRTKEQALEQLAQKCVGQIQSRISAGLTPALAASTIKEKGSSTPLVDTGQLRSSISYRVEGE